MSLKGLSIGVIIFVMCIFLISIVPNLFPDISQNSKDLLTTGIIILGFFSMFMGVMARGD